MGYYVNVIAKKGCENQINDLWSRQFSGWLIYTSTIIRSEIDYIAKNEEQKHLRWINTVKKWNEAFPICAERKGQVFIRAFGYNEDRAKAFSEQNEELRKKVKWIMDYRLLFESITGLRDAVDALEMMIDCDALRNGRPIIYPVDSFDTLPFEPNNRVYQVCVAFDKARLWKHFFAWRDTPDWTHWEALRDFIVPGEYIFKTIWQNVELIAQYRDNQNYGLSGRYRNGLVPPETDVVNAILCNILEDNNRKASSN